MDSRPRRDAPALWTARPAAHTAGRRWTRARARIKLGPTLPTRVRAGMRSDVDAISGLLLAASAGDRESLDRAFDHVYAHLKKLAHAQLLRSPDATLSTTGLVHEAYLKLSQSEHFNASSSEHFYSLAARSMRQILVDRARSIAAQKREGAALRVTLTDAHHDAGGTLNGLSIELLDLDRALTRLETIDARLGQLVDLRLFAGMEIEEIANLRGTSARTVLRDWRKARALLSTELDAPPP
ncbi:MAG: ECF-type sigma factor [Tahibacter sp.]